MMVTDCILDAMDKKMLTALVLLDLSKVSDSVSHTILLRKLSHIGVAPEAVMFDSYF